MNMYRKEAASFISSSLVFLAEQEQGGHSSSSCSLYIEGCKQQQGENKQTNKGNTAGLTNLPDYVIVIVINLTRVYACGASLSSPFFAT